MTTSSAMKEREAFDAWKKTMDRGWDGWDAWQARAALSPSKGEGDAQDAARYRYLVLEDDWADKIIDLFYGTSDAINKAALDAAIDDEIAKTQGDQQ